MSESFDHSNIFYDNDNDIDNNEVGDKIKSDKVKLEPVDVSIKLPAVKKLPVESKNVCLNLPRSVSFQKEMFNEFQYNGDEEKKSFDDRISNIIRRREKRDENGVVRDENGEVVLESNAKIVEWDDGTLSLIVGSSAFDLDLRKHNWHRLVYSQQKNLLPQDPDSDIQLASCLDCLGNIDGTLFPSSNQTSRAVRHMPSEKRISIEVKECHQLRDEQQDKKMLENKTFSVKSLKKGSFAGLSTDDDNADLYYAGRQAPSRKKKEASSRSRTYRNSRNYDDDDDDDRGIDLGRYDSEDEREESEDEEDNEEMKDFIASDDDDDVGDYDEDNESTGSFSGDDVAEKSSKKKGKSKEKKSKKPKKAKEEKTKKMSKKSTKKSSRDDDNDDDDDDNDDDDAENDEELEEGSEDEFVDHSDSENSHESEAESPIDDNNDDSQQDVEAPEPSSLPEKKSGEKRIHVEEVPEEPSKKKYKRVLDDDDDDE